MMLIVLVSVNRPGDLLEWEGTCGLPCCVCQQGTGMEDKDGELWTICCDGHDSLVCHIEAVTHIQLSQDLRTHTL